MIEDASKHEYAGEQAADDEVLPPTPRMEEHNAKHRKGKGKGKGGSPRSGAGSPGSPGEGGSSPRTPGSGTSSPRTGRSNKSGQDADKMQALTAGAPKGTGVPQTTRRGAPRTDGGVDAAAAGGNLSVPKPQDKARDQYWDEEKKT